MSDYSDLIKAAREARTEHVELLLDEQRARETLYDLEDRVDAAQRAAHGAERALLEAIHGGGGAP